METNRNAGGKEAPAVNFPGFDYLKGAVMAWMRMLGTQGTVLNNAWGDIQAGRYSPSQWLQTASTMWSQYYQTVGDLVRGPFRTPSPVVEYFYYSRTTKNAVYRTLSLPPSAVTWTSDGQVGVTATPLRPIGGGPAYPQEGIALVTVPDQKNAMRVTFTKLDDLKAAGEYVGFIYKPNTSEPPLFVLILIVTE
jgi:hypothetical protein